MNDFKRINWLKLFLLFSLFAIGLGTVQVHAATSGRANNATITNPLDGIGEVSLLAEPTVNLAPTSIISSSVTFSGMSYINDGQTSSTARAAKAGPGLHWVQLDLGAVHELSSIKLWHYFGDGRSYRDVVVQLSNDPTFSSGVVTVFNNDTDGSAGLGVGTDSEYKESSFGKLLSFNPVNARYARFYTNGSNVTGWNHYVEIEVYGVGIQVVPTVNLAPGSTISTSTTFSGIPYITDSLTTNSSKAAKAGPGLHWVQLDLGAAHDLYAIKLWHYFSDGRIYRDVIIQLSNDPTFSSSVVTAFNNDKDGSAGLGVGTDSEYKESSSGKMISFNAVNARYARFYSNGSSVTGWNHYVEIEIYGHELSVTEVRTETLTTNKVSYTRVEQLDNTFPAGETQIIQAGVDGYDTVTYAVTYTDGVETSRVEVSRVTTAPIDEIVRVGTQQIVTERITVTENTVTYQTVEQEDASLLAGERVIQQAGTDGYDTVKYDVTYTNGEETGRVEVSRVTTAPVDEIVRVGPDLVVVERTTAVEQVVAYQTVEQEDASLPMGERVIQQTGADGYDTVTYDVTYTNGEETGRVEVSRVTTAPIEEIVLVGTYSDDTYVIYAIADTHLSLDTSIASLEEATLSRSSIVAAEEQGVWMTAEGTFVTAATVSERTQRMQSFAAIANADQPDFVLHLGDGTAGPSDWNSFLAAWNSIYLPKLFVPGNHDFDNTSYASVASMFGYNTRTTIGNNKFSYAQEISLGDISFLLLDVDTNRVDNVVGFQTKLDWAAGQLNSTTSPLALIVAHTAPHNYLRNSYDGPTAYAFNQIVLNALSSNPNLERVQGIFGHEHPSNTYVDLFFGPDFPGLILKPNVYTVGSYTKITIDSQNNITWEQRDLY